MRPSFRLSRREVLTRIGGGFGAIGLASLFRDAGLLAAPVGSNPLAPRPPHFPARAKRVIFLFMNGGPSHVDTFDPTPSRSSPSKPASRCPSRCARSRAATVAAS
jgi:hypothetical protein